MYGVELYAAVRLAVVDEGLSHHEAGRRFGIDRRTVKKMLSYPAPPKPFIPPPTPGTFPGCILIRDRYGRHLWQLAAGDDTDGTVRPGLTAHPAGS